jgi:uncharacterized protein
MPDPAILAALTVAVLGAGFVNGTIGFGFSLLVVNVLAVALGAKPGIVVISLIAPVMSGTQLWHFRAHAASWMRYRTLLAAALVGSLIGAQLLVLLPGSLISLALGLFTASYVVTQLRAERPALATTTERVMAPVAGLVAGLSNGSLGASGPVLGTYLTAIGLRGGAFVFAISLIFFSMAFVRGSLLAVDGLYTAALVATAVILVVPAWLGQRVGFWLRGRLRAALLQRVVLLVLLVAAADLLVRGAQGLIGSGA